MNRRGQPSAYIETSGSIRSRNIDDTLQEAREVAREFGITRHTNITAFDFIGIPVYSAVRPRAAQVVVTAGKGRDPKEAEVGAILEAIEQEVAARESESVSTTLQSPREAGMSSSASIGDFCPTIGVHIDVDRPIHWVEATDIANDAGILVPVETVLFPCPTNLGSGYFGSSTNGLASGNTRSEAIIHALCEVIERDITSFNFIKDSSILVDEKTLPEELSGLIESITAAGLRVWLRWVSNPIGQYFTCVIDDDGPIKVHEHGGYGFHPVSTIAASRAITEAVQSRLTFIQGTRDDIVDDYEAVDQLSEEQRSERRKSLLAYASSTNATIDFRDIPSYSPLSMRDLLNNLVGKAREYGFGRIVVYDYHVYHSSFKVVRVVVPGAEMFDSTSIRVGPRLAEFSRKTRRTA